MAVDVLRILQPPAPLATPSLPTVPAAGTTSPRDTLLAYYSAGNKSPTYEQDAASFISLWNSRTTHEPRSSTARAGENELIPDIYGEQTAPALLATAVEYNGSLVLRLVWCRGEVNDVVQVRLGGAVFTGTATHYVGTESQGVDPTLAAAISGYADTLPGICYSVLVLAAGTDISQQIEALIEGRILYDPRLDDTVYSNNATLCLADFIERNTPYDVNWDDVEACADENDDLLADGSKRRTLNLLLAAEATIGQWMTTLREYAGVYLSRGNTVRMTPLRPRAVDHAITASLIRDITISKRSANNSPNWVWVEYTDKTGDEWTTKYARAPKPTGELRQQTISLLGIDTHAQAYRQAVERQNYYTQTDLLGTLELFDDGLALAKGDVISITHRYGLVAKEARVVSDPVARAPGRWSVAWEEYSQDIFSDSILAGPSPADTNLPNPLVVPTPANLVLAEELHEYENGIVASRLRITWDAVSYPWDHYYAVRVRTGGQLVWSATPETNEYITGALVEGQSYTVSVHVVGYNGLAGTAIDDDITSLGNEIPPPDVTGLVANEVGGRVYARWNRSVDLGVVRYELRYAASDSWAAGTVLDVVDTLRIESGDIPAGSWYLLIKALDNVDNYSASAASVAIEVTLGTGTRKLADGYLETNETDTANMVQVPEGWVTSAGDSWSSLFPSAMSGYTNPLYTYHASVTSEWYSESLDLGAVKGGTFQAMAEYTALSGTATAELQTSDDDSTWTSHGAMSANTAARYARVKISATTTSTLLVTGPAYIRVDVVQREESTPFTTDSNGDVTINLDNDYSELRAINPALEAAGSGVTWDYDNFVPGAGGSVDLHFYPAAVYSGLVEIRGI